MSTKTLILILIFSLVLALGLVITCDQDDENETDQGSIEKKSNNQPRLAACHPAILGALPPLFIFS